MKKGLGILEMSHGVKENVRDLILHLKNTFYDAIPASHTLVSQLINSLPRVAIKVGSRHGTSKPGNSTRRTDRRTMGKSQFWLLVYGGGIHAQVKEKN